MAKKVDKSGLLNTDRRVLKSSELIEGKYYVGKIGQALYTYQNITKERSPQRYTSTELGYINGNFFNQGSLNFKSNFSEHYEATEEEILLLQESIKNGKYTPIPEVASYIIKMNTGNDYQVALDKQGKVEWTEEIQGILKYLKDDLKVSYKGSVNYKPKNLGELKKIINT